MSVQRHTIKGKTAIVAVAPDGSIINANVEDLTILVDDGIDDEDLWSYTFDRLPPVSTYAIEGSLSPITDSGVVFEIRRNA